MRSWISAARAAFDRQSLGAAALFLGVVVATAIGLLTRTYSPLAAFWPANAVLAGALVVFPGLVRWWTFPTAAAASFLTDLLLTDDLLLTNLWLTLSNVLSAGFAWLTLSLLPAVDRRLGRPASVGGVLLAALAGAVVSASLTCWLTAPALGMTVELAWFRFAGGEFANLLILLPFLLTLPSVPPEEDESGGLQRAARLGGPALTVLGLVLMIVIGGPAFLTYPLPGLLLTAASRPVLPTAALALVSAAVTLLALGESWINFDLVDITSDLVMSTQVGLALIALGPIAVSITIGRQRDLVRSLRLTVAVDGLTGALTRTEFLERADRVTDRSIVLLLDIDHFKSVNDTYGHAAGDAVLSRIGDLVRSTLQPADLFGRLGGEEFAIVVHDGSPDTGRRLAEHLCSRIASTAFDGVGRPVTVSIGLTVRHRGEPFRTVLLRADELLYQAKAGGRDQVMSDVAPEI